MRARDLGGDVEAEAQALLGGGCRCRGRTAGTGRSAISGGIGVAALATDSSNTPSAIAARTRTGWSGAPWCSALPSRLDSSWPMRRRSHAQRGQRGEVGLDRAVGIGWRAARRPPARASASAARSRRRCSSEPAAEAAAGEVEHVVDQPAMRAALRRASGARSSRARSSSGVRCSSCMPASIEASGLRRSWPSTAMNCSRSSAGLRARSAARPRWSPARSLRVEVEGDQLGEQLEHADRSPGLSSCAGRGSIAQSVPKKRAVGQDDRHRDVALEAVHRRRVVAAERRVLGDVVDDHRLAAVRGSRRRSWSRP